MRILRPGKSPVNVGRGGATASATSTRQKASRAISSAGSTAESRAAETKKEYDRLFAKGVRLLSMREHSAQEITDKLSAGAESLDIVYAVIDELNEKRYLSDERYAESYVRSRTIRGFGPLKIRAELKNKGIKNSMIDEYLNVDSPVWYDNARNQYRKKYGDEPVTDYNAWTKRARFLQSRGFTTEHIQVTLPSIDHD